MSDTTLPGSDGQPRCRWCAAAPEFQRYHDAEWGFPVDDDFRLFEKLSLESFQSGLSWRTILVKRENFRKAFKGFDYNKLARFGAADVERLLQDDGIVRHRGKIEAVLHNARVAKEISRERGSLAAYLWQFEPSGSTVTTPQSASVSPESLALSKDLKKMGWKFLGPTTAYAFMQAMGLVNDHVERCVTRFEVEQARSRFKRPT